MKTGITLALAAVGAIGGTGMFEGIHVPFISSGYSPQAQCVEWYDGCNMCNEAPDGSISCSHRICENPGKGFCRSLATTTAES